MAKNYALAESVALKHAKFSIKPLVRKDRPNTGLFEYNMVMHETVKHTDQVYCKADGRVKVYKTGLDETVSDVQTLPDEEKAAKIASIRRLVARAERELESNYNVTDPETKDIETVKDFWKDVTVFKSVVPDIFDNKGQRVNTYWDELQIELTNEGLILDENSVKDMIIMNIIEAGGFGMIANSYEQAMTANMEYKFYLDKRADTSAIEVIDLKIQDKAAAKLFNMSEKDTEKLFYITKLTSTDSLFFKTGKNATPNDVLYKECRRYIDGETAAERVKTVACEEFVKMADLKLEKLIAKAVLRDLKLMREVIYRDTDIYHPKSGSILGKNDAEAIEHITSPGNIKLYETMLAQAKKEWNK